MAGNDERVNLLISAAVEGLKNVEGLITDLQELEKTGQAELPDNSKALREGLEETSTTMEGLAGRLNELRDQQGLVSEFADLKRETRDLAEQQTAAKERATELGRALAETENPSRAQRQEFEQARRTAKQADEAWISNQQQLNSLRDALNDAGISTSDLAGEQVRINNEIQAVNDEAAGLSHELHEMRDSAVQAGEGAQQAADSTQNLGDESERTEGLVSRLGGGLRTVGAAVAGLTAAVGASVATMSIFSKRQASVADDLTNTANALRMSREELQVWQIAGERVGITGDGVANMLTNVTERLGRLSATGSGRAGQIFEALNMDIREFRELAPDQQMLRLANAIEQLDSGSEQVGVLRALGRDAERLFPLLQNNAEGLRAIRAEAEQAGAIYTEQELDRLNRANDVYNTISIRLQGLTRRIGAELAPAVGQATERIIGMFDQADVGDRLVETFQRLIRWGENLAARLLENQDQITEGFQKLGQTISFIANSTISAFRGVQTVITGFVTLVSGAVAGVMEIVAQLTRGLNQIGVVSDQAFARMRARADAAHQSVQDLVDQTAEYGKATIEAGRNAVMAFSETQDSVRSVGDEADRTGEKAEEAIDRVADATDEQAAAAERARAELRQLGIDVGLALDGISESASNSITELERVATNIEGLGVSGEEAAQVFEQATRNALQNISSASELDALRDELRRLFDEGMIDSRAFANSLEAVNSQARKMGETVRGAGTDIAAGFAEASRSVRETGDEMEEAGRKAEEAADTTGRAVNVLQSYIEAASRNISDLGIAAQDAFAESTRRLQDGNRALVGGFGALARNIELVEQAKDRTIAAFDEQGRAHDRLMDQIADGSLEGERLIRAGETALRRFDMLDDQTLSGLRSAIDSARREMESLGESAAQSVDQLRDELDRLRGDQDAVEERQHQRRMEELKAQLDLARQFGDREAQADLQESLRLLEEINRERQKQQQDREREKGERKEPDLPSQTPEPSRTREPTARTAGQRVELRLPTGTAVLEGETEDTNRLLDFLAEAGLRSTQ